MKNYYETLGVDENASEEEIKSAYRQKAKQHHPDLGGDKAKFQEISEANDTLSDPQKKAEYDHRRKHGNGGPHFGNGFGPGGFNFGGSPFGFSFGGGPGFDPFSNIEEMLRRQQQRNQDINVQYNISLDDAYNGGGKEIQLNTQHGPKNIKINIPAGVENGMRLKVSGQGDSGIPGLPPGDLYLHVNIVPHATFQRDGQHLRMRTRIDAIEAMLGTEKTIKAIDGTEIIVKVPSGVQVGNSLRVQGKGMPIVNSNGKFGDLYVEVHIDIPRLDKNQMDILRQIKKTWK